MQRFSRSIFRPALILAAIVTFSLPAAGQAGPAPTVADLRAPLSLKPEDEQALLRWTVQRLRNPAVDRTTLPANLAVDVEPRVVVLAHTSGDRPATSRTGTGRGILAAIDAAAGPAPASEADSQWVKLDIVRTARSAQSKWKGDTLAISFGEGVATAEGKVLTWEELAVSGHIDARQRLDPHALSPAPAAAGDAGARHVWLVTCDGLYTDGTHVRRTRHDNWLEAGSINPDELDDAIRISGDYLRAAVDAEGKFVYQYDPSPKPATVEAAEDYNIVRHAGAVLSMVYAYDAQGRRDDGMRAAMERSIRFMLGMAKPAQGLKDADVIVEKDEAKLGANGLGLNAIALYTKSTGDQQFLPAARRLANWIVQTQGNRGEFTIHGQRYSDGHVFRTSSPYAPGEAIWGLCTLHDLDPQGPWLDAAVRGVDYLITTRDRKVTEEMKLQDHWLLYAIENVCARRLDEQFERHALRMVDFIVSTQVGPSIERPEWVGAYTRPPNANQTATRVEGLSAAYRLFSKSPQSPELMRIRASIEAGGRFQLRQQYLIPQAIYYRHPRALLGGFRNSPTDPRVRIDTVQHNLVALLGVREAVFPRPQAPAAR